MLKAKVYVVYDGYNTDIEYIGCSRLKAIDTAIEMGHAQSFADWLEGYGAEVGGETLLEFLDEPDPKASLFNTYMEDLNYSIDEGDIEGIECYDIDIPLDSLDIANKVSPEVLAVIVNIFNS